MVHSLVDEKDVEVKYKQERNEQVEMSFHDGTNLLIIYLFTNQAYVCLCLLNISFCFRYFIHPDRFSEDSFHEVVFVRFLSRKKVYSSSITIIEIFNTNLQYKSVDYHRLVICV